MTDSRARCASRSEAIAWRARQIGPVVFTNGVFDLLHPGHVELLETARARGRGPHRWSQQRRVGANAWARAPTGR